MKKTKIVLIIVITILIGILATTFASYANDQTSIFVNLTPTGIDEVGYRITANGEYIWDITTYTDENGTEFADPQKNLYCIRANYGYSWEDSTDVNNPPSPENIVEYNLSYDLLIAKEKLIEEFGESDARSVIEN